MLTVFKDNVRYFECIDTFGGKRGENIFTRRLEGDLILYIDNKKQKIIYSEKIINCKPIIKEKLDAKPDFKIATFDVECYVDHLNMFRPYACGFATKSTTNLYYLTDFKNAENMFMTDRKSVV